ncbi:MAG: hypothetical protein ACXWET_05030 [Halobacteriota archaeon]
MCDIKLWSRGFTYRLIVGAIGSRGACPCCQSLTEEVNKMVNIKLPEIVKSNYCRYDLHSACVKGENTDIHTCAKCTADAFREIIRY